MRRYPEAQIHRLVGLCVTRRKWLRVVLGGWGIYLAWPWAIAKSAGQSSRLSILEQFLGEELRYQIGFWLFPRCGEARTHLVQTADPGVYKASLKGRTVGFADYLLGRYRYAYISYLSFLKALDPFRPMRFEFKTKRSRETYIELWSLSTNIKNLSLPNRRIRSQPGRNGGR